MVLITVLRNTAVVRCSIKQTISAIAVLSCIYGFTVSLLPTPVLAQPKDPIHVTAEILRNKDKTTETRTELAGGVQFEQGSIHGSADSAVQFPLRNVIELYGHVKIRQDTLILEAPKLVYDGNSKTAKAEGKISFRDRKDKITSEWGTYDMNTATAEFHTNVKATKDSATLTCSDLTYIRGTQTMVARGKVVAKSDSGTIYCDTLIDARTIGERTAIGNVKLFNDSLTIFCRTIHESNIQKKVVAVGNIEAYSKANNTVQFGDSLIRNTATGYSLVPEKPLLLIIDSSRHLDSLGRDSVTTFDTLFIKSKTMEAFQGDSGLFIATDSVRMLRSNFCGTCGKLIYYKSTGVLTLFAASRQHIWYDSTEIDGDSIIMYQKNNKPERIVAIGHAFATTPYSDSGTVGRMSQLSSKTMTLTIIKDTVRTLLAVDNALTIYFASDNGKPNGLNRASGDSLRIDFEHNTARQITVLSNSEGEYWPEKYIGNRGAAFRLGNYERSYDHRPRRSLFILDWTPIAQAAQ